ncbi:hypothetical protein EDC04DRAFT_2899522 [Pisolithus marmoratus]|nr:hypothetical protein EDC04DRAFT_2899522 [Pisolithus marmoratus]
MSSVTDSDATINGFVNTIHPNFDNLISISAFSACLFTLFVFLFALSTKGYRRRPVFRLNVSALCIVLTMSVLAGLTNGKAIVNPFNQVPRSVFVATVVFVFFPQLLYDSILLTRLCALYPPATTPPVTLLKIFAFPFCVKCARVVVVTIGVIEFVESGRTTEALKQAESTVWFRNPFLIAEWTMQIADNAYSVSLFLYNLHSRVKPIQSDGITISGRIRRLFYISAANFVFPLMFNVVLLVFVTTRHSPNTGALLVFINNYITVTGVLCATLWFSRPERARACNEPLSDEVLRCRLNLGRMPVTCMQEASEIVVAGTRTIALYPADLDSEAPMDSKQLATRTKEDKCSIV